jgi:hypothetical protein
MRVTQAVLLLIGSLGLSGCVASSQSPALRWTAGFWFWEGSSLDPAYSGATLDVLFAQVGTISSDSDRRPAAEPVKRWHTYGRWPDQMPAARDYWLVYRYERQGVPGLAAAEKLAGEISSLRAEARERNLHLVGIQLDIDSPTSALPRYAEFLSGVRKGLPTGFEISITALLDWFRSGTAIDDVIKQVDEFVPQFYDIGDPAVFYRDSAIASRIDPAHWGPVFNRFHKRFRIGISSFGRARLIPNEAPAQTGNRRLAFYGDLQPLDIATNPAFELRAERNQADETVLNYRATRKLRIAYNNLNPGDTVQFIVSTPEAIRAAVHSAREIKGNNAGVVFFRWPAERESQAMQPDEVLDAAGVSAAGPGRQNRVHVVAGDCAAVECVDVYLESAGPLSPRVAHYRIHASTELEYFLPEKNVPARLAGASDVEVSLPPYCGRGRLYIGRAVSLQHAEFTVDEAP